MMCALVCMSSSLERHCTIPLGRIWPLHEVLSRVYGRVMSGGEREGWRDVAMSKVSLSDVNHKIC